MVRKLCHYTVLLPQVLLDGNLSVPAEVVEEPQENVFRVRMAEHQVAGEDRHDGVGNDPSILIKFHEVTMGAKLPPPSPMERGKTENREKSGNRERRYIGMAFCT